MQRTPRFAAAIFACAALPTLAFGDEATCKAPVVGKCVCTQTVSPKEILGYNTQGASGTTERLGSWVCKDGNERLTYVDPAPIKHGWYHYGSFAPDIYDTAW